MTFAPRVDMSGLLTAVEDASPAEAMSVAAYVLRRTLGVQSATVLIADAAGSTLVDPGHADRGVIEGAVRQLELFVDRLDSPPPESQISVEADRRLRTRGASVDRPVVVPFGCSAQDVVQQTSTAPRTRQLRRVVLRLCMAGCYLCHHSSKELALNAEAQLHERPREQ